MITLTTPASINSVLGGNSPVAYPKLVLVPMNLDPINRTISATVRITSTTNPDMQPIMGTLNINAVSGLLEIGVPQLDFLRRVSLNASQKTAVETIINNAQNAMESGLITLGVIAGTQSTGT